MMSARRRKEAGLEPLEHSVASRNGNVLHDNPQSEVSSHVSECHETGYSHFQGFSGERGACKKSLVALAR